MNGWLSCKRPACAVWRRGSHPRVLLICGASLWTPEGGCLAEVDILGPSERRRVWSAEEKAALLAEIDAEGGKVRLVARRRGVSESLLYNW